MMIMIYLLLVLALHGFFYAWSSQLHETFIISAINVVIRLMTQENQFLVYSSNIVEPLTLLIIASRRASLQTSGLEVLYWTGLVLTCTLNFSEIQV